MARKRLQHREAQTTQDVELNVVPPPARRNYPDDDILDVATAEIEEIVQEEAWWDRRDALGRAIWEVTGVAHKWCFGDPDVPGACPQHNPQLAGKLKLVDNKLGRAKDKLKAPFSIMGNSQRLAQVNEMVVLLDNAIRVTRLIQSACQLASATGTQDATMN